MGTGGFVNVGKVGEFSYGFRRIGLLPIDPAFNWR